MRKLIKELKSIRGRHTELVSVYVPAGGNLIDSINQLKEEQGTASNIKSKATRNNVLAALDKIIQHLRSFRATPKNGFVVFCGNVSPIEGKEDIRIWDSEKDFKLPEKIETKVYWCDQVFVLEPLEDLIKEKEVYGLIVVDGKEANVGLLKGKRIIPLKHIDSNVPSKTVKGGMCLAPNTLIQLSDGRIVKISELKESDNPIKSVDLVQYKTIDARHNEIMKRDVTEFLEIKTKGPEMIVKLTPEHRVFVPGKEGFEIKYAEDLKIGDNLLTVRRIQTDEFVPEFTSKFLNCDGRNKLLLFQFLGYVLGDGTRDMNRIILYDSEEDIIDRYKNIAESLFKINTGKRFRKEKGCFEVKIYSKELLDLIDQTFRGIFSTPRIVNPLFHRLSKKVMAYFIRGLFDAEGYIDTGSKTIGITMSSENVIRILQLLLFRFGIISSYNTEKRKYKILDQPEKEYLKHRLRISDFDSLVLFKKHICFGSKRKSAMLINILKTKKLQSNTQHVPVNGKFIRKLAGEIGMNTESFPKVQDFFYNKKRQGFRVFKKEIIRYFEKRLSEIKNTEDAQLISKAEFVISLLHKIHRGDLILTHITKISRIVEKDSAYDISIPATQNFLANSLIVHNSQGRYDRLREDAINEFLTKVGDVASQTLLDQDNLKGIIIGGPGPMKDEFAEEDYLNYQLKKKLLGIKAIGYTGEYGLEELVKRSEDLLEKAALSKERDLMQKFFVELQKSGKVVYGYTETTKALEMNAIEMLLVSEAFDWVKVNLRCQSGHYVEKELPKTEKGNQTCETCGNKYEIQSEEELSDLISERAVNAGAKVELISTDTQEGRQFKELGGIGALLRFKID